jgi:hypothetical protein
MKRTPLAAAVLIAAVALPFASQINVGYTDTPLQPNGKWHIHDPDRPQPTVVTPGGPEGPVIPPPSDAVVLIGRGSDLTAWSMMDGTPATWEIVDGVAATGRGMIRTKRDFADVQLHVEFQTPAKVEGDSQGRGNSGVFLMGAFEIQVLDSYQNRTYADGSAAAMYGQFPPLVNASRRPGEWQAYDIVFMAPRFKASGDLVTPAIVTVLHNGLVVHHATAFYGPTQHRRIDPYSSRIFNMARGIPRGPVALQDHGNPIHYRNVWVREIKDDTR